MSRTLGFKVLTIALLALLLLIPLLMIDGLVQERQRLRSGVENDIARSSSYAQQITGPVLVVPYVEIQRSWKTDLQTGERYEDVREIERKLYFLPQRLNVNGQLQSEVRERGIYQVRLYQSNSAITGHYVLPKHLGLAGSIDRYRLGRPFLAVGISDIRGISNQLTAKVDGRAWSFLPGTNTSVLASGVHAPLPALTLGDEHTLTFAFDLQLQGTGHFSVVPVGEETRVSLSSDWPHPSFSGEYLPRAREVTPHGFTAQWQTSFFATDMQQALLDCRMRQKCGAFQGRVLSVSLIDPVDQYLKTERAMKYALLFIGLTFAVFFLFEVLKSLAIHPVQYALVGLALAFFYLLLLSLAEHMAFAKAYLIAAAACIGLLAVYSHSVLRDAYRAIAFSALLAGLYGMLYVLLSAEDFALLLGSVLVFGLLAAFMLLTRKLDWYAVGRLSDNAKAVQHD
ncbi:cell envelope integrity protein CreD [Atopomonas sediminilitoris]|uniref:cell envelope integrity protein CreD n=1 Tax=Atopomonas sediminilitoris TaxID=2919919 RepID=UPI001F4EE2C5|nr:cell envelope integrity protein CreD [Atopomonas sediminilitoris]MCJ8169272.1 cell envelope integrity protein CreD [Atopomonas sediminilitoris]